MSACPHCGAPMYVPDPPPPPDPRTTFECVTDAIAAVMEIAPVTILARMNLRQDLGVDSLDEMRVLHLIEDSAGVDFDDMMISRFRTVADLVVMVDDLKGG